jgi:hypothetical protein
VRPSVFFKNTRICGSACMGCFSLLNKNEPLWGRDQPQLLHHRMLSRPAHCVTQ